MLFILASAWVSFVSLPWPVIVGIHWVFRGFRPSTASIKWSRDGTRPAFNIYVYIIETHNAA